jgi:Ca2+-binding RTX toxin-like protein
MTLATSLTAVAVAPGGAPPAAAVAPGPNGRIVVSQTSSIQSYEPDGFGGNLEYFIGSGAGSSEYVSSPEYSPDGNRLAFWRYYGAGGGTKVLIGQVGESSWTTVSLGGYAQSPTWSPDGSRVAFAALGDIYVVNADGSHLIHLVHNPPAAWGDENPAWSPDGTKIATEYRYNYSDNPRIDLIDARDGSRTSTGVFGIDPAWSPDGGRIAYSALRGSDNDIFIMSANGAGPTPITSSTLQETNPAWSPDGLFIAFQSVNGTSPYVNKVNTSTYAVTGVNYGAEPSWGTDQGICRGLQATITGTPGGDTIRGSSGDDVIQAGAGNDLIFGGGGHDIICGGAGEDMVSYVDHTGDVTAVLGDTSLRAEDVINGDVENLTGGPGDDRLIGNGGANEIVGGRGDDVIKGGEGDDLLEGEGGDDELRGGVGDDDMYGGTDSDTMVGGPGSDSAFYSDHAAAVTVTIGGGVSNDGNKTDGPAGERDLVAGSTENVTGTNAADALTGNDSDNTLTGVGGNDHLTGGAGADRLRGGAGSDTLVANDGEKDFAIDCGTDADPAAQYDAGLDPAPISC